ncbi:MBL fold metallo-hydrolase [Microvirga antarctica]|uniref:MBL fold metallo-hydrolase n=1 Tax=Microvirga antarctica TaxID=2819233 RepID=UPI001B3147A4
MTRFICVQCGTQFAETETPPLSCPICEDERQYVRWSGQDWTSLSALQSAHRVHFTEEDGVTGIGMAPSFAIGQRALMVQTDSGVILWDCIALIDDAAKARIAQAGGLRAIAISHPHYYTAMVSWSEAFGGVPIHLHADDRPWVMHPDESIHFWSGETQSIAPGITLIRTGGHFEGSTVLHDAHGAEGRGVLYAGDNLQVCQDRRYVSFMRSYPNYIPLNATAVSAIADALAHYPFERIYGAFAHRNVSQNGKAAMARSVARYLAAIRA